MNGFEMNEGYVLVTPAKNEGGNLVTVANGIANQTVAPRLWVIVDDGSTDRTSLIIENLKRQWNWIASTRLPERARDLHHHYAEVCTKGFNLACSNLDENGINYEFVGLIDADTVVEPRYFEKLLDEFKKDLKLGLASGGLFYEKDRVLALESGDKNSPRGTGRL